MIVALLMLLSLLRELRKSRHHNLSQALQQQYQQHPYHSHRHSSSSSGGGGGGGGGTGGSGSAAMKHQQSLNDDPSSHQNVTATTTTGTFSSSLEDLQATSISETMYSSATSGTFRKHSSVCSDATLPPDTADSRRSSEDQVRVPSRRYFGGRSRSRYGSRGSLPRRRRTTGRLVKISCNCFSTCTNF